MVGRLLSGTKRFGIFQSAQIFNHLCRFGFVQFCAAFLHPVNDFLPFFGICLADFGTGPFYIVAFHAFRFDNRGNIFFLHSFLIGRKESRNTYSGKKDRCQYCNYLFFHTLDLVNFRLMSECVKNTLSYVSIFIC